MIDAIDVNIIHVEQQQAVCCDNLGKNRLRICWPGASNRHVLHRYLLPQDVLNVFDAVTDVFDGLLSEGMALGHTSDRCRRSSSARCNKPLDIVAETA